jgi:hypothetical protein
MSSSSWRLGLSFALGGVGAVSAFFLGLPGRGEFIPAVWLAAFAATLIAPGWPGFVALIAGVVVLAVILDLSDVTFGLAWLIVAILTALAALAALSASVLLRLRALGWAAGLKDSRVLGGAALAVALVLIFVWFAGDVARNPP